MARWATKLALCVAVSGLWAPVSAQTNLPAYVQAEDAFVHLTLDQRIKLQVLLTAAGYWPAVPDENFSTRLFNAILRFEGDNGFVPLGILNDPQMDRLKSVAAPYLNAWRFEVVKHPMINNQIWVPMGLPLEEEPSTTGLRFVNRPLGVVLTYDFFPDFNPRPSWTTKAKDRAPQSARVVHPPERRRRSSVDLARCLHPLIRYTHRPHPQGL
jgi:serine protease Do